MTDEQAAKLRELAERARKAEAAYVAAQAGPSRVDERRAEYAHDTARDELYAAVSPDVVTALLDERDFLKRDVHILVQQRDNALAERDAAMALLKKHGIDYEP